MGDDLNDSSKKDDALHASDVPPPPVRRSPNPEPSYPAVPRVEPPPKGAAFEGEEEDEFETPEPVSSGKLLGLLCHLLALLGCIVPLIGNVLGPLVLWMLKRRDSKLVEVEARKSVNFQILFSAVVIVLWLPILMVGGIPIVGGLVKFFCVMAIVVGVIANVVYVILGTRAVNSGQASKYPVGIDILGMIESKLAKTEQGD